MNVGKNLLLGVFLSFVLIGFTFHQDVFAAACSDFTDEPSCSSSGYCAWENNMCVISLPSTGSLSVTKDANPNTIYLEGSGGQEITEITIDVSGFSIDKDLHTIFVMDSSTSVEATGWDLEKDFVVDVIQNGFPDESDLLGIITFSTNVYVEWDLNMSQDRSEIISHLQTLPFLTGFTSTRLALNEAIDMYQNAPFTTSEPPRLLFLITDGVPVSNNNNNPCLVQGGSAVQRDRAQATRDGLTDLNVKIIIIGVGNSWNPNILECLVDDPASDIIAVEDFNSLSTIISDINAKILATNTPSNINLIETTNSYIIDENNFSILPDSITTLGEGQTQMVWNNIAQHVGNGDEKLSVDETFSVSFDAKSTLAGVDLPVNDLTESTITFDDPDNAPMSADLPQALITVIDPFPTITVPSDITEEATSSDGANVGFVVTGDHAIDGPLTPTCDATSGDLFPIATTTVTCSVTDSSGNIAEDSFTITVEDTTPPTLDLPDDIELEAEGPNTRVFFDVSASDIVDGDVTPTCSATSGDTFPLGPTTVTCSATDDAGNTSDSFFDIVVVDTTAPELIIPDNISTSTGDQSGTIVIFDVSASDLVDGDITPICDVSSGSIFPIGTTTVTCSATDSSGNTSDSFFDVIVELSYKGQKEAQITSLEQLTLDADKKTHKDLEKAIKDIQKSLDEKFWASETTLDEKHGHKVFDEEKSAVKDLLKIQKDDPTTDVSGIISALVDVDRQLAQDAINAATSFAGDKKVDKELEKANDEMDKAQEELDDGKPDKAIDHFKKAWEHAQKAIKHATK
ncbi:MAG: VWA domain-containing protein [Crenarchaeota archaeon]|nr:MAG: VWA domain-containing protein [Thermoproteota archaeon]